jgi:hypothetical protein
MHDCLTSNDPLSENPPSSGSPGEVRPAAWLADRGEQLRVEARLPEPVTRHFKRHVAVTPARFVRRRGRSGRAPICS